MQLNCKVNSKDANVAGYIRHTGHYTVNAGDRIDHMSQFIINVKCFIADECGSTPVESFHI